MMSRYSMYCIVEYNVMLAILSIDPQEELRKLVVALP